MRKISQTCPAPSPLRLAWRDAAWQAWAWVSAGGRGTNLHAWSLLKQLTLGRGVPPRASHHSSSPSCPDSCTDIRMTTIFILLDIWHQTRSQASGADRGGEPLSPGVGSRGGRSQAQL